MAQIRLTSARCCGSKEENTTFQPYSKEQLPTLQMSAPPHCSCHSTGLSHNYYFNFGKGYHLLWFKLIFLLRVQHFDWAVNTSCRAHQLRAMSLWAASRLQQWAGSHSNLTRASTVTTKFRLWDEIFEFCRKPGSSVNKGIKLKLQGKFWQCHQLNLWPNPMYKQYFFQALSTLQKHTEVKVIYSFYV